MHRGRRRSTVEVVRSARNVRAVTDPAVSSQTSAALRTLPTRSRCAQTLRDMVIACSDGRASAEAGLAAATHRSCPPGVLIDALPEILDAGSRASNPRTRLAIVAHPTCSTQILNRMSLDRRLDVVSAVAAHPSTPTDRLADLSTYRRYWRAFDGRGQPVVPVRCVRAFAADPDYVVRSAAAANLACPSGALDRLSSDPSAGVRSTVASHPRCPSGAFDRFAADPDVGVRSAAAANLACPSGAFDRFAADPSARVRFAVASHPRSPADVLGRLSSDPDVGVRSTVASHPRCPSGAFRRFAADPDVGVRSMVASRSGVGTGILQQLTRDTAAEVALWPKPSSPGSALHHCAA